MWTPKEVRNLIAQCAGILFGIGGVLLMIADVKATGKINISTNLLSGQIESGSAGLLLLFFAFFLILIPAFYGRHQITQQKRPSKNNSTKKTLTGVQKETICTIISSILTVVLFLGAHQFELNGYKAFSNGLIIGGYCFGAFSGVAIIATFFDFIESGQVSKDDKKEGE